MVKKLIPLLVLVACLGPGTIVAQAAGKPSLAAGGYFGKADDGAEDRPSFSVNFYSKTRFTYRNDKELKRLADRYRPTQVTLIVKGKKIRLNKIGEAMPEFVFGFFAPAKMGGIDYDVDLPAKLTFKNKTRKTTQTLKVTLKHETPEDPGST